MYVDVILPVPLHDLFTYSVPPELVDKIYVGSRVIVQFGKKKFYTAIVSKCYEADARDDVKEISFLLEDYPILNLSQLQLWNWIATYYMCTLGDVYRAALPAALKIESETYVLRNPEYIADEPLSSSENRVYQAISSGHPLRMAELDKLTDLANVIPHVKSLADKGALFLKETLDDGYKQKTEMSVVWFKLFEEGELINTLDSLRNAHKQRELLIFFIEKCSAGISKKELLQRSGSSSAVLSELIKKEILAIQEVAVDRIDYGNSDLEASCSLNAYQQQAYAEINTQFESRDTVLLHGVTGSGKTEIYIQLIKDIIANGKQVLYLVPEIALTTQITDRLKRIFGNKMSVYHSKFNEQERAEVWNKLLKREIQVVLGVRSSVFLPFFNLGLVIVDEEHETSFKQQDPAPRYNGRNVAMVLATMQKAKTLLGTATPALETYYNALHGRYGLVNLTKRHADIALPHIEIVNVKELRRKKQMKSMLSPPLIKQMQKSLADEKQVILFQNRRGFAPLLECKVCSWTPLCNHCDVSLTYHKGSRTMVCHYCGSVYRVPEECPNCETPTLEFLGYGTERIEEEVLSMFPEAKVARMDLDTTRGKKSYEKIIEDFECGRTNVLIGTQMVSKGLDFDNVNVVGILNADNLMNYPDFRAHERAFQILTQVSGRSGRKSEQGTVMLQTSHPNHPVIQFVKQGNYLSFYHYQIEERKLFRYPPFFRLVEIVVRHRDERIVDSAAKSMGLLLKKTFGDRVLGPTPPPVSRIQRLYIRKILLKIEHHASISDVRENLKYCHQFVINSLEFKSLIIHYNVDPV